MKKMLSLVLLTGLLLPLGAQQVSQKQDLTLLPMSVYGPNLDRRVISSVDARIKEVFVNLGRFNVLGLTTRLDSMDTDTFISLIRDMKAQNLTRPDAVKFGDVAFTAADYDKLVGSFIAVIPQISNFSVDAKRARGRYTAVVETSFTFLRGSDLSAIKVANIKTEATEDTEGKAVADAIAAIPAQLTYEIRMIPEFQLQTGVLEVNGADVVLELGKDLGIQLGDEFVLQSKSMVAGFEKVDETGLMIIKDVQDKFSIAQVIYGNPVLGDPARELPRFGVDFDFYAQVGLRNLLQTYSYSYYYSGWAEAPKNLIVAGLKATATRGFFDWRPTAAVEIPFEGFGILGALFIPFNAWAGVDHVSYMGRLNLNLGASVGVSGLYDTLDLFKLDDQWAMTHLGLKGEASAAVLLGKDYKIQGTAGARVMLSLVEGASWFSDFFGSYYSGYVGGSFVMKY